MVLVLWTKGLAIVVVSVATEYLDLLRQLCIFFTAGFGLLWIWPWAWPWPWQMPMALAIAMAMALAIA